MNEKRNQKQMKWKNKQNVRKKIIKRVNLRSIRHLDERVVFLVVKDLDPDDVAVDAKEGEQVVGRHATFRQIRYQQNDAGARPGTIAGTQVVPEHAARSGTGPASELVHGAATAQSAANAEPSQQILTSTTTRTHAAKHGRIAAVAGVVIVQVVVIVVVIETEAERGQQSGLLGIAGSQRGQRTCQRLQQSAERRVESRRWRSRRNETGATSGRAAIGTQAAVRATTHVRHVRAGPTKRRTGATIVTLVHATEWRWMRGRRTGGSHVHLGTTGAIRGGIDGERIGGKNAGCVGGSLIETLREGERST